jgi:hypothetical protein
MTLAGRFYLSSDLRTVIYEDFGIGMQNLALSTMYLYILDKCLLLYH